MGSRNWCTDLVGQGALGDLLTLFYSYTLFFQHPPHSALLPASALLLGVASQQIKHRFRVRRGTDLFMLKCTLSFNLTNSPSWWHLLQGAVGWGPWAEVCPKGCVAAGGAHCGACHGPSAWPSAGAGDTSKCTVALLRPSEGEGVSFSQAAGAVVS